MTQPPLSGRQHLLVHGDYVATVASVGATLRELRHAGRDLVVPFAADELRPRFRGATLAPWPNRVADGRYELDGVEHQLALTEPDRGNALHGLAVWLDFRAVAGSDSGVGESDSSVTLAAVVEPQAGYPWRVAVETTYALGDDGLTQTVRTTNLSATTAPVGVAPHPYLVAGPLPLDTWTLHLPADQVLSVTDDRLLPVDLVGVEADPARFDFREPRALGEVMIDHAFTGLRRNERGLVTVTLTAPGRRGVAMTWDAACPWVQIHTADIPGAAGTPADRLGLAVEPMTCAPDALNTGRYRFDTGLWLLGPGTTGEASWTISALG